MLIVSEQSALYTAVIRDMIVLQSTITIGKYRHYVILFEVQTTSRSFFQVNAVCIMLRVSFKGGVVMFS